MRTQRLRKDKIMFQWLVLCTMAICAVAIFTPPSYATEPRRITIGEAVEIALTQNTSLLRSTNQTSLDAATLSDATMRFFPDLDLGLSGSKHYSRSFNESDGDWFDGTSESMNARLSTGVVLFDGLANVANLKGARLKMEAGLLDEERIRQTVVFYVLTGFIDKTEAEEHMRVRNEDLKAQQELEVQIQTLVEGGERPVSDLYQQQSAVASARFSLVEARRTLALTRIDLTQALQLDPAREYLFETQPITNLPASDEIPELSAIIEKAFLNRSDLQALQMLIAAAEENHNAASAGYWPSLSLSAGYGTNYSSTTDLELGEQLVEDRSGDIQLSLSVPLFDRFETRSDVDRAEIALDNARLSLYDLRQETALQVRRALLDWRTTLERLQAAKAQELAARKALDFIQERYNAGVATLYEVTLLRADFVEATSAVVSASYNMIWQERLLDYYTGTLDPDEGLAP